MIRVPLLSSSGQVEERKFVEISQAEMPQQAQVLVDMLTREQASIEYWLEIAVSCRERWPQVVMI